MRRLWARVRLLALLGLVAASTSCGAVAVREDAAKSVAEKFYPAVAERDGPAACRLLAPGTLEEFEQSQEEPCTKAVVAASIPAPGAVGDVEVYGGQARVVFAHDTVFLAAFTAGWRVTALGCQPRGGRPYQCEIKGL